MTATASLRIGRRRRQQKGGFECRCRSSSQGGLLEERSAANRERAALISRHWHELHSIEGPAPRQRGMNRRKGCAGVRLCQPKSEVRSPKSERRPKVETRSERIKSEVKVTEYQESPEVEVRNEPLLEGRLVWDEGCHFGLRSSGFFRTSGFGFRISGLRFSASIQSVEPKRSPEPQDWLLESRLLS